MVIVFLLIFKPDTLKALLKRIKPAMEELKATKDDLKEAVQPAREMADEVTKPAVDLANELTHPLTGENADNETQSEQETAVEPVKASGKAPQAPQADTKNSSEPADE